MERDKSLWECLIKWKNIARNLALCTIPADSTRYVN